MGKDWQATVIKIAAVATATPRWVAALLAAEGLHVPPEWLAWWLPASALLSAMMAIVEGWAFAYIFEAWRNQRDKASNKLAWMALASGLLFVVVLTPYIAASVSGVALAAILANRFFLLLWSASVAASTIAIVATVGYAQKERPEKSESRPQVIKASEPKPVIVAEKRAALPEPKQEDRYACEKCGRAFGSQNALNAHSRVHERVEATNGHR